MQSAAEEHLGEYDRIARRLGALAKSDPQVAAVVPDERVTKAIQEPGISLQQVVSTVLSGYAERPALGVRAYDVRDGARHYHKHFNTISYAQLAKQAEAVSAAWRRDARFSVQPDEFVACVVFTGAEFAAVDLACIYSQARGVPIQAKLASDAVVQIMEDTAPAAMAAAIACLAVSVDYVLQQDSVRSVLVTNADTAVDGQGRHRPGSCAAPRIGPRRGPGHLCRAGRDWPHAPVDAFAGAPRERRRALHAALHVGQHGHAKGGADPRRHPADVLDGHQALPADAPRGRRAGEPLDGPRGGDHDAGDGRHGVFTLETDLSTSVEYVQTVRPTFMQILQRFAEILYQTHLADVQTLVKKGVAAADADAQIQQKLHHHLGDRLVMGVIGSSPTAPEVKQFFRNAFDMAHTTGKPYPRGVAH